jgi:hypothetical protein
VHCDIILLISEGNFQLTKAAKSLTHVRSQSRVCKLQCTVGRLITKNKSTDTRQTTFTCKACKLVAMLQSPTCVYSVSFGNRLHSDLRSTSLSKPHSGTVQKFLSLIQKFQSGYVKTWPKVRLVTAHFCFGGNSKEATLRMLDIGQPLQQC